MTICEWGRFFTNLITTKLCFGLYVRKRLTTSNPEVRVSGLLHLLQKKIFWVLLQMHDAQKVLLWYVMFKTVCTILLEGYHHRTFSFLHLPLLGSENMYKYFKFSTQCVRILKQAMVQIVVWGNLYCGKWMQYREGQSKF